MKLFLAVFALALLLSSVEAVSFIPAMDIMVHGADGELKTIWGEHNFYQDTTSFGHPVTYNNGTLYIGG